MKKDSRHPEHQYLDLMQDILDSGEEQVDAGTGVKTYSVFGRQIRFDLSKGFPLLTTKKVYWNGVLQELYWFLSGQTNIKYLVDHNVHIWDDYPFRYYNEKVKAGKMPELTKEQFVEKIAKDAKFAKTHGELPHIYGEMWRKWPASDGRKVDQLGWIVDELRKDKDAHNTVLSAWNPEFLYAMAAPGKAAKYPICHNMFQVNIKHGKVCLQLYQRSCDVFLGVPFNIASYALLAVVLAKILGREPGEFIHTYGDIHIYENHFDQVKEQLKRKPKPFPTIEFNKSFKSLEAFRPEFVELKNYEPHPPIKAELSVVGGYNEKLHGKKKKLVKKA
ncbi:MAG: thymidylate synthase [Candidatus Pacebacteria bacterium]|nr:thymidylate synthase [Candidatus Paceibacterota bacterium]